MAFHSGRSQLWKEGVQLPSSALPFERAQVTEGHRAAWREAHKNERPRFLGAGGTPFEPGNGNLWIERVQGAKAATTRYDVIAPAGRVISEATLPARSEVVGFGAGTVYVGEKDANDVLRLRQYRYPQLPSGSRARPPG